MKSKAVFQRLVSGEYSASNLIAVHLVGGGEAAISQFKIMNGYKWTAGFFQPILDLVCVVNFDNRFVSCIQSSAPRKGKLSKSEALVRSLFWGGIRTILLQSFSRFGYLHNSLSEVKCVKTFVLE